MSSKFCYLAFISKISKTHQFCSYIPHFLYIVRWHHHLPDMISTFFLNCTLHFSAKINKTRYFKCEDTSYLGSATCRIYMLFNCVHNKTIIFQIWVEYPGCYYIFEIYVSFLVHIKYTVDVYLTVLNLRVVSCTDF